MKLVRMDPPGTFCTIEALRDLVRLTGARTFIDVGCGGGTYAKLLCDMGLTGVGIDSSRPAILRCEETLAEERRLGKFRVIEGDAVSVVDDIPPADLGMSLMVLEHVEDDVGFVRALSRLVKPGGYLAICVPGRKDCWSFEDETVGHYRRYDRDDLVRVLDAAGLKKVEVWSVAVPTANLLLRIGEMLIKSSAEAQKANLSRQEQTELSGIPEIPWKTMFPSWVRLILNRYTLYPLFILQRAFYRTSWGVQMLGFARVE